jgi:ABC-type nitrate/sulfonate/bicarbonate transport system substrate-binding protein
MSRDLNRRTVIQNFAAGILAVGGTPFFNIASYGQDKLTKVSFTLPWIPHGAYSAFIVARELGYWKDRGLDVDVSRGYGSGDANKKVGLGQFAYGDASFAVTIQTVAQGMDLVGLALHMQISPLCVFALKKSGIRNPKDLEGRTVAATPTTGDYHMFPAFARATQLDVSKIKFRFVDANVRAQVLLDGSVDALLGYYSSEGPPLWTGGGDIEIMLYHKYGIKLYDTGMLALRSQIEKFPEVTKAIVEGAMEGLKYTYLKPADTLELHIKTMKEFQGSDRSRETVRHQIAINTALGIHPGPKAHGLGYYDPAEVRENVQTAQEFLKLEKPVDPERIFTNQYVGSVKLTSAEWTQTEESVKSYVIW